MPIQSASTHQATAEAPVARSRAGQTDQREGGEVFTLPEAEVGKEATAGEQAVDPGKVRAKVAALQPAPSAVVATATPASPGTPVAPAANAEAGGIALLIAMAAGQIGSQAEAAGKEQAVGSGDDAGEAPEGAAKQNGKAAAEGEGEARDAAAAAAVVAPVNVPLVIPPPVVLAQGPLPAVDAAAGEPVKAMSPEGGAKKDTAKPPLGAATAGLALVGMPTPDMPRAASAGASEGRAVPAGLHPLGAALREHADTLSSADQPGVASGGPAPAEAKALDALQQQPADPFDLSTLLQQMSGKSGNERLVQPFDPSAAPGAAPGAPGQGTAGGQPTPIHVVPIEIGLRAMSGSRQFDIRLDPDELGRVDVSLSISDKGEVSARLVVDRVETLHLLQRDARTLERAFEQAGLKPSDSGVDITLRDPSDQSAFRQNRQQDEAPQRTHQPDGADLAEDAPLSVDPVPQRRFVRLGGVDLSI